jgi:hypothetical protein
LITAAIERLSNVRLEPTPHKEALGIIVQAV